jgi:hypothetical protein
LYDIKEAYGHFKEQKPEKLLGFSKFPELWSESWLEQMVLKESVCV